MVFCGGGLEALVLRHFTILALAQFCYTRKKPAEYWSGIVWQKIPLRSAV